MRPVAPRTGTPEITIAENQLEYAPLVVAVYGDNADLGPVCLLSRWRLSEEERAAIAAGADIYHLAITFGKPFNPIQLSIGEKPWMRGESE